MLWAQSTNRRHPVSLQLTDYYYEWDLYSASSQVAAQLRTGAANGLEQLRIVSNKWVLSLFLKTVTVTEISGALSSTGTLFQTRGPWTAKLRSAYFVLVLGTTSCLVCAERRWRRPVLVDVGSQYDCRCCGTAPCWHLYARTAVLKVIRRRILAV